MNKEYKDIQEIIRVIPLIGKTPDIINGFMEGDVINIVELFAKYNFNYYFEVLCKCINESSLESFKSINSYILEKIESNDKYYLSIYKKYHINILTKYK